MNINIIYTHRYHFGLPAVTISGEGNKTNDATMQYYTLPTICSERDFRTL